jgi:ribonuclease P/MRP protein subunit POP3
MQVGMLHDGDNFGPMTDMHSLISPLGEHRRTHVQPSNGKKRKRKSKDEQKDSDMTDEPPPPPEISKHILVGINSVTRHLETLVARNAPATMPSAVLATETNDATMTTDTTKEKGDLRPLSMVIITHPKPSASTAHAHLPTLVHLSTTKSPTEQDIAGQSHVTRLIPLASSTDARIASDLHIPRVGALAIFADAPGARALNDFVREKVGVTSCPFIDEALAAKWKGINVKNEGGGKQVKGKANASQKKSSPNSEQVLEAK